MHKKHQSDNINSILSWNKSQKDTDDNMYLDKGANKSKYAYFVSIRL